ncbi:hypothetical protein FACS189465_0450 [Clostridia bacterium]|nr:hypothetical protein FACS189465_0450 [Clostridia bacterium]
MWLCDVSEAMYRVVSDLSAWCYVALRCIGSDKVDLLETREYGNRCIKPLGFYVTKEHEKMGIG